jgi:hypothetical protein
MAAAAGAEYGEAQMPAGSRAGLCFDADELLRLRGELAATDSPTKRAAAAATQFGAGTEAELQAAGSDTGGSAEEVAGVGHAAVGHDGGDGEADGGAADLAGSFLEGLGETSAMLRAALAQHSSVMQLVDMLDGLGVAPDQQPGTALEGQQQAEQEEGEAVAEWSSAAIQTAAWVAATAADEERAASSREEACL